MDMWGKRRVLEQLFVLWICLMTGNVVANIAGPKFIPKEHVAATVKGTINPANWSLKRDYEALLAANGWTRSQLNHISTRHEVVYFDHTNILYQEGRHQNVTSRSQDDLCPANMSLVFTAFGQDITVFLTVNHRLHSPLLLIKAISQTATHVTSMNDSRDCFYRFKGYEMFGTFAWNGNGEIRASLDTEDQVIAIVPLSIQPSREQLQKSTSTTAVTNKFPHLIYTPRHHQENSTSTKCGAYSGSLQTKKAATATHKKHRVARHRLRRRLRSPRDIRFRVKWIELGLIFDSSLLHLIKSAKWDPREMALDLVNLIDQIFQPLKTKVVLAHLELWPDNNQIHVTKDSSATMLNLMSYSSENLYSIQFDSLQLLTAMSAGFVANEFGSASANSVCTLKSVGVVHAMDGKHIDLLSLATKLAHSIGHNLGIHHDNSKERDCICPKVDGCVMHPSVSKTRGWGRPIFSSCAQDHFLDTLQSAQGSCLLTSPFNQDSVVSSTCGDGIVDQNEDCDCGSLMECMGKAQCCDPITCLFREGAECSGGLCCTAECKFKREGSLCRETVHECDLPERCSGHNGSCPADGFKKPGFSCQDGASYCHNRSCVSFDAQCKEIWGRESTAAQKECAEYFQADLFECPENNSSLCLNRDSFCGVLNCQGGEPTNLMTNYATEYSTSATLVTMNGRQFECKTAIPNALLSAAPSWPIRPKDGTKCGHNKMCLDGLCTAISPITPRDNCPTNNRAVICSRQGTCDDLNKCSCDRGFTGHDCSLKVHRGSHDQLSSETDNANFKHTVYLSDPRSVGKQVMDNFLMLIIMGTLIAMFLLIFVVALFCYKRVGTQQPELIDFYADSDHSGTSYDAEPVKPISDYSQYFPNRLRYEIVPGNDGGFFPFGDESPESEMALLSDAKVTCSPCSVYSSPRTSRRALKCDAAVSPFLARRRERMGFRNEDWLSEQENGYLPDMPCNDPSRTHVSVDVKKLPSRIRDFELLLEQLNTDCLAPTLITKTLPKLRAETKDIYCQVNLDTELASQNEACIDGLPAPMNALTLPKVLTGKAITPRNQSSKELSSFTRSGSILQPQSQRSLGVAEEAKVFADGSRVSPRRRRRFSMLRRQEQQFYNAALPSADFSSGSDDCISPVETPKRHGVHTGDDFFVM